MPVFRDVSSVLQSNLQSVRAERGCGEHHPLNPSVSGSLACFQDMRNRPRLFHESPPLSARLLARAARGKAARSSAYPACPCPCGGDHPSPRSPTTPHQGSEEEDEEKAAFYSSGVSKAGGGVLSDSPLGWFSQGVGRKKEASTVKYIVMSEPK